MKCHSWQQFSYYKNSITVLILKLYKNFIIVQEKKKIYTQGIPQ